MIELVQYGIPTALLAVVLVGLAPRLVLRAIVCGCPKDSPRRRELLHEFEAVPFRKRPLWVADIFAAVLLDGVPQRLRDSRTTDVSLLFYAWNDPPATLAQALVTVQPGTTTDLMRRCKDGTMSRERPLVLARRGDTLLIEEQRRFHSVSRRYRVVGIVAEDWAVTVPSAIPGDPPICVA